MVGRLISLLLWSVIWFHSHSFCLTVSDGDLQTFQNTHTDSHSGESLHIGQHLISKRGSAMLKSFCTKKSHWFEEKYWGGTKKFAWKKTKTKQNTENNSHTENLNMTVFVNWSID